MELFCQNKPSEECSAGYHGLYSDSHSYPWRFIYCVKYLNVVFVLAITLLLHLRI